MKLWDLETGEVCNSLHCYWPQDFQGGAKKAATSYNHGESEGLDVVYTEYKTIYKTRKLVYIDFRRYLIVRIWRCALFSMMMDPLYFSHPEKRSWFRGQKCCVDVMVFPMYLIFKTHFLRST